MHFGLRRRRPPPSLSWRVLRQATKSAEGSASWQLSSVWEVVGGVLVGESVGDPADVGATVGYRVSGMSNVKEVKNLRGGGGGARKLDRGERRAQSRK